MYEGWVGREKKIRILLHPLNCQISLEISHSYTSRVDSFPFVDKSQPPVPPTKYSKGSSYHLGTRFPKGVVLITNGFSHLASKCNPWLIQRQNSQVQIICAEVASVSSVYRVDYSFSDSVLTSSAKNTDKSNINKKATSCPFKNPE